MKVTGEFEYPDDKRKLHRHAVRLEWITVAYLLSAILFIYLTLGASQAMKAAWFEDIISLVPAIAFLVADRIRNRQPNERFPYGYHRAVNIAFLCAAVALTTMGFFLFYDSVSALVSFEHPSIGVVQPTGEPIWLGWLMIPALLWSAIPAAILGRKKLPLARALHDKVLYADALMNKADWLTAGAAIVGVLGIGVGLWWADGVAAAVISIDIFRDGVRNLKASTKDLMDSRPTTVDDSGTDPLPARVRTELIKLGYVQDAEVRLREEGHVYFGEIFLVFADERDVIKRCRETGKIAHGLDWRLHDIVVSPVESLEELSRLGEEHKGRGTG